MEYDTWCCEETERGMEGVMALNSGWDSRDVYHRVKNVP